MWQRVPDTRLVRCRKCSTPGAAGTLETWAEDGRTELRDSTTGERHVCSPDAPAPIAGITHTDPIAEIAKLIPDKAQYDTYVPRKLNGSTDLETIVTLYKANTAECEAGRRPMNVLLMSDAGAGKNHLLRAAAYKLGIPYVRFPMKLGLTIDGLFGKYLLDGKTVWQDGILTRIVRHGKAIVCFDEVNATLPELAMALHSALDDERVLIIEDRPEYLHIPPGILFVGTGNPDYAGTRPMNEAFRDRFGTPIPLDYETSVEKKLIGDDKLLTLATKLRAMYRAGDGTITSPTSTRFLLDYLRNVRVLGPEIAKTAFLGRFTSREEQRAVGEVFSLVMEQDIPLDVEKDVNLDG